MKFNFNDILFTILLVTVQQQFYSFAKISEFVVTKDIFVTSKKFSAYYRCG